jgi:hypothetical protein
MRSAALALTALVALGGSAPVLAGSPTPTAPGRSTGTAVAFAASDPYTGTSGVSFSLTGTLAFGNVVHEGRFLIEYRLGDFTRATLREGTYTDPVIGKCASYDTAIFMLEAPAVAVIKCRGHFPEKDGDKVTTLSLVLPEVGSCGPKCFGYSYSGQYAG